jgi:ectoine hydroxylase-related dioxygenase (phytanoyl-CoA dioxygenase family)
VTLAERGFVVIPGPVPAEQFGALVAAYDHVMASATAPDARIGTTTTRVSDVVNRGAAFDALYVHPPLLDACRRIIGGPFKLSSLVARTLRPHMPAQGWHVDVRRDSADWPLVGFILMVDAFRPDNGATRFVPGSHHWTSEPTGNDEELRVDRDDQELACGPAGSLLIFNGSAWHGHTANTTDRPRRSLHGAFIPQAGKSATDFAGRMSPETLARLGHVARKVLCLDSSIQTPVNDNMI